MGFFRDPDFFLGSRYSKEKRPMNISSKPLCLDFRCDVSVRVIFLKCVRFLEFVGYKLESSSYFEEYHTDGVTDFDIETWPILHGV